MDSNANPALESSFSRSGMRRRTTRDQSVFLSHQTVLCFLGARLYINRRYVLILYSNFSEQKTTRNEHLNEEHKLTVLFLIFTISLVENCDCPGGSGLGALSRLIESSPYSFRGFGLDIGVDPHEQVDHRKGSRKRVGVGREGGGRAAAKVWQSVR